MRDTNLLILVGNVAAEPECRYVGNSPFARLSVATGRKWRDEAGNEKEKTEYHRVEFWGKLAKAVEELVRKGSLVSIQGRLEYRKYSKDGRDAWSTDVVGHELCVLSGGKTPPPPADPVDPYADAYPGGTPNPPYYKPTEKATSSEAHARRMADPAMRAKLGFPPERDLP